MAEIPLALSVNASPNQNGKLTNNSVQLDVFTTGLKDEKIVVPVMVGDVEVFKEVNVRNELRKSKLPHEMHRRGLPAIQL